MRTFLFALYLLLFLPSTVIIGMAKEEKYPDIWAKLIRIYTTPENEWDSESCQNDCNLARILVENQLLNENFRSDPVLWAIAASLNPKQNIAYCQKAVALLKSPSGFLAARRTTVTLSRRTQAEVDRRAHLFDALEAMKEEIKKKAEALQEEVEDVSKYKQPLARDVLLSSEGAAEQRRALIQLMEASLLHAAIEIYEQNKPQSPPRTLFGRLLGQS
jgi:hypothetical protein